MSQFIELINNKNDLQSVAFYFTVIGVSVFLAFGSQFNVVKNSAKPSISVLRIRQEKSVRYFQVICLFLSFLVLWFVSAFANCGADRASYGTIFSNVSLADLLSGWQEPGFIVFNMVFRIFGDDPRIIYIAISTLTLFLFYRTWYVFKTDISIGYAVLAYGTLFFVQSLSLMRIYLASAILFCGISFLKTRRYVSCSLLILLATLIHYSSLVMFLPLVIVILLENHKYMQYVHVIAVVIGLFGIGAILIIGSPILQNITIFARFQRYLENVSFSSIGVMQFIYNIPICVLIFLTVRYIDVKEKRIMIAYAGSAFLLSILSYGIQVLGRTLSLFSILYMFIIPECMKCLKTHLGREKRTKKIVYILISFLCFLYFILRFMIYLGEYQELDAIIPYKNILF